MAKKVIYITGPIDGVKKFWEPFEKADDDLTGRGYCVLNPSTLPVALSALARATISNAMLAMADAVLLLPGWEIDAKASSEELMAIVKKKPVYWNIEQLCEEVPAK